MGRQLTEIVCVDPVDNSVKQLLCFVGGEKRPGVHAGDRFRRTGDKDKEFFPAALEGDALGAEVMLPALALILRDGSEAVVLHAVSSFLL